MREEWLKQASYPAFIEGPRRSCRKILVIEADSLLLSSGERLRVAPGTRAEFAGHEGAWSEIGPEFRPGDWIGLERDAEGILRRILLLAPQLREFRSPKVARETLAEWNAFLAAVRRHFAQRGFLEVQTPTLVTCPGTEPFLDVFETRFQKGRDSRSYFLPTSPELHLKKLVAAGYGPLFEIRPCFRNGEISPCHQPEFWMLEWYRPGQDLSALRQDCLDLVRSLAKSLKKTVPGTGAQVSMSDLFLQETGIRLTPDTGAAELVRAARDMGLHVSDDADFDDIFYLIFVEKVEPRIPQDRIVFVQDYPPSQAALARLTSQGWGDRFEMYWRGFELANAYHELNDPIEQRRRSQEDLQRRERLGKSAVPLDEEFFRALEAGMPPTAGIALGLERLFLALTERKSLEELRLFPMRD